MRRIIVVISIVILLLWLLPNIAFLMFSRGYTANPVVEKRSITITNEVDVEYQDYVSFQSPWGTAEIIDSHGKIIKFVFQNERSIMILYSERLSFETELSHYSINDFTFNGYRNLERRKRIIYAKNEPVKLYFSPLRNYRNLIYLDLMDEISDIETVYLIETDNLVFIQFVNSDSDKIYVEVFSPDGVNYELIFSGKDITQSDIETVLKGIQFEN